ncbi:flavin reductase family protein [Ascidiimonas aurantiaca]|uniref:flavin reductase family protein n=1 Tax=Ascidiimonas aurantiaca TaxID=1685432 RepID=UPI0030ED66BA
MNIHYTQEEIKQMDRIFRLNLINSCAGYKPANLIATASTEKNTNVAVFNSVMHIGSNPPLLGFLMRPLTVPRDTYKNIKETGYFTVNHIVSHMVEDAHHSSASYPEGVSEFNKTKLEEIYLDTFPAPYVKDSPVKIGCRYVNEYVIKENETRLIIGQIEHLYIEEKLLTTEGSLKLDEAKVVAITGLDTYSEVQLLQRFAYARPDQETKTY